VDLCDESSQLEFDLTPTFGVHPATAVFVPGSRFFVSIPFGNNNHYFTQECLEFFSKGFVDGIIRTYCGCGAFLPEMWWLRSDGPFVCNMRVTIGQPCNPGTDLNITVPEGCFSGDGRYSFCSNVNPVSGSPIIADCNRINPVAVQTLQTQTASGKRDQLPAFCDGDGWIQLKQCFS